jgi:hypothetical protein
MLDINNYFERLVTDQLWKITLNPQDIDIPISQAFIEDVACLALNKLPPCYVRSTVDKSSKLTELNFEEMSLMVSQAIAEAIEVVKLRPHDNRDLNL